MKTLNAIVIALNLVAALAYAFTDQYALAIIHASTAWIWLIVGKMAAEDEAEDRAHAREE